MRKLLLITSYVEIIVGILFVLVTQGFLKLLLGTEGSQETLLVVEFVGIALIGFGISCVPNKELTPKYIKMSSVKAMLFYNLFAGIFFFYILLATSFYGVLLCPAAIIHSLIAILYLVLIFKN